MELVFGHLEVLHFKFHDPTISNLGDQSRQINTQTHKHTDRQTNKQTDNAIYIVDYVFMSKNMTFGPLGHILTLLKEPQIHVF